MKFARGEQIHMATSKGVDMEQMFEGNWMPILKHKFRFSSADLVMDKWRHQQKWIKAHFHATLGSAGIYIYIFVFLRWFYVLVFWVDEHWCPTQNHKRLDEMSSISWAEMKGSVSMQEVSDQCWIQWKLESRNAWAKFGSSDFSLVFGSLLIYCPEN